MTEQERRSLRAEIYEMDSGWKNVSVVVFDYTGVIWAFVTPSFWMWLTFRYSKGVERVRDMLEERYPNHEIKVN